MGRDVHDRIVARAHAIWVAHGCPPDSDAEYLYQATQEVELCDQLLATKASQRAGRRTVDPVRSTSHH